MSENPEADWWFKEYTFMNDLVKKIKARLQQIDVFTVTQTQYDIACHDVFRMVDQELDDQETRQAEHARQLINKSAQK
jgi:hypothetical protein